MLRRGWAVDLFFCTSDGWEQDWTERNLPDDFHDVLSLMGQALHDTVKTPHIAATSTVFLSNCSTAFAAEAPRALLMSYMPIYRQMRSSTLEPSYYD